MDFMRLSDKEDAFIFLLSEILDKLCNLRYNKKYIKYIEKSLTFSAIYANIRII